MSRPLTYKRFLRCCVDCRNSCISTMLCIIAVQCCNRTRKNKRGIHNRNDYNRLLCFLHILRYKSTPLLIANSLGCGIPLRTYDTPAFARLSDLAKAARKTQHYYTCRLIKQCKLINQYRKPKSQSGILFPTPFSILSAAIYEFLMLFI